MKVKDRPALRNCSSQAAYAAELVRSDPVIQSLPMKLPSWSLNYGTIRTWSDACKPFTGGAMPGFTRWVKSGVTVRW